MAYNPIVQELAFQHATNSHIEMEVDEGTNLAGSNKWLGSAMADNGKIYHAPNASSDILVIDTKTNETYRTNMGVNLSSTWSQMVKGADGKIYGVPNASTSILIIDPETDTATLSNMGANLSGTEKWFGGVLAPNGKIYCIPRNANDILVIDTINQSAIRSNLGLSMSGTVKWIGGAIADNGIIYCSPVNSTSVLLIDTNTETAYLDNFGINFTGTRYYSNAVFHDGYIYLSPTTGPSVVKIDTVNNTASEHNYGLISQTTAEKYHGVGVGKDGKIYFVPYSSGTMLVVNPKDDTAELKYNGQLSGSNKWRGNMMLADNGYLYNTPFSASDILMIDTDPTSKDYQKAYRNTCFHNLGGGGSTSVAKSYGGPIAPNGKIIAAPLNAGFATIIDTNKNISYNTNFGGTIPSTTNKFEMYALGSDGKLYFSPHDTRNFMIVDPETETATYTDFGLSISTGVPYRAMTAYKDKIYCLPYSSSDVLVIDVKNQTAEKVDYGLTFPSTGAKFNGAVLGTDNKIYGVPFSSDEILVIDPETETATLTNMGADLSGTFKWRGGYLLPDGRIMCIPHMSNDFLMIDTELQIATRETYNISIGTSSNKLSGAAFGTNGKLYLVPSAIGVIFEFDYLTNTLSTIPEFSASTGISVKWLGAVSDFNGTVYMMAGRMPNILRVKPKYVTGVDRALTLSPRYNKF